MTEHQHTFSKAMRGHRTGIYLRRCVECGLILHSTEQPREEPVSATEARVE